jgi:hypothetical protein
MTATTSLSSEIRATQIIRDAHIRHVCHNTLSGALYPLEPHTVETVSAEDWYYDALIHLYTRNGALGMSAPTMPYAWFTRLGLSGASAKLARLNPKCEPSILRNVVTLSFLAFQDAPHVASELKRAAHNHALGNRRATSQALARAEAIEREHETTFARELRDRLASE